MRTRSEPRHGRRTSAIAGTIYWFTGQPGTGKTTLARALAEQIDAVVIDGDRLRYWFPADYDEPGRRQNILRAQRLAGLIAEQDRDVCVAVIAPYRDQREALKARLSVLEIYLHAVDPRGKEQYFVADYEVPQSNYLDLDTGELTISECLAAIRAEARTED